MSIEQYVTRAWYKPWSWLLLLLPFSFLFGIIAYYKRKRFLKSTTSYRSPLPIVVVGNITVGGTGKSPLIAHIAKELRALGYEPGIVCSGYGSALKSHEARLVTASEAPRNVGDEPMMLFNMTGCNVAASPQRVRGIKLLESAGCNVILCDDGMQHYKFQRDVEICLLDAKRALGNGWWIPAGPLRESKQRLESVDMVVTNGGDISELEELSGPKAVMSLRPDDLRPLDSNAKRPKPGAKINAVAGIGNPERFFSTLEQLGYDVQRHAFPDHYDFQLDDFRFESELPIIMTEKDAVKCSKLKLENAWYLPVKVELSKDLVGWLTSRLIDQGYLVENTNG